MNLVAGLRLRRSLIDRAVHGERKALTVLLAEAEAGLRRRFAHRIPLDMQGGFDADDLLQLIYADAFRCIGGLLPGGEDAFDRWLATIAIRRLRDAIRRHRAAKRGGDRKLRGNAANGLHRSTILLIDLIESRDRTPSRVVAAREAVAAVAGAVAQLPEDYQRAVQMVYLEGYTVAQTAEALGRTNRAIHNLCFKAKRKLRDLLGTQSRFLSSTK